MTGAQTLFKAQRSLGSLADGQFGESTCRSKYKPDDRYITRLAFSEIDFGDGVLRRQLAGTRLGA